MATVSNHPSTLHRHSHSSEKPKNKFTANHIPNYNQDSKLTAISQTQEQIHEPQKIKQK